MSGTGAFELHVRPGDAIAPARVSIAVQRHAANESGLPIIMPECWTLDELDGQISALQDDLDKLRVLARRIFLQGV